MYLIFFYFKLFCFTQYFYAYYCAYTYFFYDYNYPKLRSSVTKPNISKNYLDTIFLHGRSLFYLLRFSINNNRSEKSISDPLVTLSRRKWLL